MGMGRPRFVVILGPLADRSQHIVVLRMVRSVQTGDFSLAFSDSLLSRGSCATTRHAW